MDPYSFLNTAHTAYFAELYDQYLINPESVEPSWRAFFQGFEFGIDKVSKEKDHIPENILKEFKVVKLINAYRTRGHLFTKTNPVRERRKYVPNLDLENFELSKDDLELKFNAGEIIGIGNASLANILIHLERIYCNSIGTEYMYIRTPERIEWIQQWLNKNGNRPNFSTKQKIHILKKLVQATSFEQFLQKKYVGQKRFSLEGGESLIPALDSIFENAAVMGVKEFVVGMAHRGRLNTLSNIFGKPAKEIFNEFDGKDYEEQIFDGDVKYHLGWTSKRKSDKGINVYMNLAPNPSHLESVGPIVQGISRAKQDKYHKNMPKNVLPVIIHGDAAIAAQGVVYEVVQMERLKGYKTSGTIHIVVNNQIGFTTNYVDARSSTYCTDVGKANLCPILHVNADDVEAVVHAANFALEYRMKYERDVFIDLLGYRKYGHNEGDEPRFTQPKLYKIISKHPNPKTIYVSKLIQENLLTEDKVNLIEEEYKLKLEGLLKDSKKTEKTDITHFMGNDWSDFTRVNQYEMAKPIDTTFPRIKLEKIAEVISKLPNEKKFINKIKRLVGNRIEMFENDKLDWSMAEHLAYGSLLMEGYDVRITGQDVERGTFSHRHAIVKVEESEEEILLLNNLGDNTGNFSIYNSLLSEYGVLGFEFGYAMADPNSLTIWEAQFGDFSNGAQIVIDQYISSGEDKWKTQNGLVLFLPHGYEGQGAEHSSARIERYLQLCAKDNLFVVNCTTPANMFHVLRRQMKAKFRKPLIAFTPKSLLRHRSVFSSVSEFANGGFSEIIDDENVDVNNVNSLVFVSGKFYYDLDEERKRLGRNDIALVRLEQLFPLPKNHIKSILRKYSNAKDIVWAQEEPINMGAYAHLLINFKQASTFRVAARRFYAATAAGSSVRFMKRHKEVIDFVFDQKKDNQIKN